MAALLPLLPLLLLHPGAGQDVYRVFDVVGPRPSLPDDCDCQDPEGGDSCYEPVCPPGYFKCCASCKAAPCYSTQMTLLSWRGLPECIPCQNGDYCRGCDTFNKCPPSDQNDREGPRISQLMSTAVSDCESCPAGQEADLDLKKCMNIWTSECNVDYMGRCTRSCRATDRLPANDFGKILSPCERMKCIMYCANSFSGSCARAFGERCVYLTTMQFASAVEQYSDSEEWLTGCPVDCSGSVRHTGLAAAVGHLFPVLLLLVFVVSDEA